MPADQTFYSFAATLIPALLFGTVRTALTPQTVREKAEEILAEALPSAQAGFDAGWKAYGEYHEKQSPGTMAALEGQRASRETRFQELVDRDLMPKSRAAALRQLRIEALIIVSAVAIALAAEGAALYGAIAANPSTLIRDSVVIAVLVGMTTSALAAFWPWIKHLSGRSRAISGAACALALALSVYLVLRGFSHQAK